MMTNSKSLAENNSRIKDFFRYIGHSIYSFFKRNMYIFIGLIAICIIVTLLTDKFFTVSNGMNILRQVSTNALLAFGMTLVMISGGIDLSIGSIVAVSGGLRARSGKCCRSFSTGRPPHPAAGCPHLDSPSTG